MHKNRRDSGGCHDAARRSLLAACAAAASLALPVYAQATTDPAVARVRAFYDTLLATMKQAQKLGVRGRYDKLESAIRSTYDLAAMTRIAVGPQWTSIPAELQPKLIDAFSRMTIATYASRFDGYSGERFDVQPQSEQRATGRVVHTKLVPSSGDAVTLDYLMRGSGDDWKIVDVYLSGTISELATRRAEFAAILKSGGPSALIAQLDEQTRRMLEGNATKS